MRAKAISWDDLEVFTAKGGKFKTPYVTISSATFLFNSAFFHGAKLKETSHVVLAYSESNNVVVFQFTDDDKAKGALRIVQRGSTGSVGSASFFSYNFLDVNELQGRYQPKKVKLPKIGETWIIYLDKKLA